MSSISDQLKNTKSVLRWLVCLAYAGLFFSIKVSNVTIGLLLLFCLIKTPPLDYLKTLKNSFSSKIVIAIFLLCVIGLLYTTNIPAGLFTLERKATLLLIPFFLLPILQKYNLPDSILFKRIGYITMASILILLVTASFKKFILGNDQAFYFEYFTYPHYVYYSIYFVFGSLVLIDSFFEEWMQSKKGVLFIIGLFSFSLCMLILIASKAGMITFCVSVVVLLYKRVRRKRIVAIAIVSFFLLGSIFLALNKTTQERFMGLGQDLTTVFEETLPDKLVLTNVNLRLLFWKIAVTHSWEDGLVIAGVGTGDVQDYLNTLYSLPKYQLYSFVNWDSHNQWVFTYIQLGLIGISIMAILYVVSLRAALRMNDIKFLIFLIVTLGYSMSESILESNKGIIFFALLFTVLSAPYQLPAASLAGEKNQV